MTSRTSRTASSPLRLAVILGSSREGRFAPVVRDWVLDRVAARGGFEVDVIDPAELDLPVRHPSGPDAAVTSLRERLDVADAFLILTPEYNHSFPAAIKQVLDLAKPEWARKSLGFVSYGGLSGGLRAVEQLRVVIGAFDAHAVADTVSLHGASNAFDDAGEPVSPMSDEALATLLDQVAWWGTVLRDARAAAASAEAEVAELAVA